ncbi:MAG: hypothetical protein ACHRHE_14575 [Tepidisphaerales bacterium]
MNTTLIGKKWVPCLILCALAAAAAGQEYQFQIDQPASGGTAQLHVAATTSGNLIGNYDGVANPAGTRTKPVSSLFSSGPGPTENLPVPVSHMDPDAQGNVTFSPTGSFRLIFDTAGGSATLVGFSSDLLGGNTAAIPVNALLSFDQFKTANPANWYPATSQSISLGNATVSVLSATQVPGNAVGTLTPLGGNQYSFSISPMVILDAKVTFQGSLMDLPSSPMLFPLAGTVTLAGNTATFTESSPVNLTNATSPNQAMSPLAYDLPGIAGPAHVIFNLTLTTTATTVQGSQTLKGPGTLILPVWTGAASPPSSAWSNAANWAVSTPPNAIDAVALFSSSTAPGNVAVDAPVTVGTLELSAGQPYAISGPQALTFSSAGAARLSVSAGPAAGHTIAAPLIAQSNLGIDIASATTLNLPGGLTIAPGITVASTGAGTLNLGAVTMQSAASVLNLSAGRTTIARLSSGQLQIGAGAAASLAPGSAPSILDSLSLQGSATLDLSDDSLVLRYTGVTPYAGFLQLIRQGSIFSSATPAAGTAAIALVDNNLLHLSAWRGQTISDGSNFNELLFVYTCAGDTNLDGTVTTADYFNIIANMGKMGATWFDGELTGDGSVTPADLDVVTRNLGASTGLPPAALFGPAGGAAVPEPACLLLAAMGALGLLRRRTHAMGRY